MKPPRHGLYIIAALTAGALGSLGPLIAPGTASAQVLPPVDDILRQGPLNDPLNETRRRLERPREELDETTDEVTEPIEDAVEDGARTAAGAVSGATGIVRSVTATALGPVRPFVQGVDPDGHAIEADVLMALLEPAALATLEQSGWRVGETRALRSLGLVLVRIEKPPGPSLAQAAGELRGEFPGAAVDYNFLYRFADAEDAAAGSVPAESTYVPPGTRVRLGLIDSAVSTGHAALASAGIVARDFAPHEGERPLGHGTAVASIMAANAGEDAEILAASVFFQKPGYAPGATTESLVAALDWLAGSEVDVINMSLAGPADELLERALSRIAVGGPVVVAAVGNNGPAGEPLYPAAYESVVGVTAIDREQRIFAYANRGDHVAFAAPGVNVKVADSGGSWRLESGTSMASPFVAAVIAGVQHANGLSRDALLESLVASALDLGDDGFDPVFGHGLVRPPRDQNAAASLTE